MFVVSSPFCLSLSLPPTISVSVQCIFCFPSLVVVWMSAVPVVIDVLSVLVVLSWSVVHGVVLDHRCGKGTILRIMTIDRLLTDVWLMVLNIFRVVVGGIRRDLNESWCCQCYTTMRAGRRW